MARILDSDTARSRVEGIIHFDTQRAAAGLDLTVGAVFRLTGPGSLDFGGSELEAAPREAIEPRLRSEDDDYGWWELDAGAYVVRYNETVALEDGQVGHAFPLERLLMAGASHAAFLVDGPRESLETLLMVGPAGCDLKENCRISRLLIVEPG